MYIYMDKMDSIRWNWKPCFIFWEIIWNPVEIHYLPIRWLKILDKFMIIQAKREIPLAFPYAELELVCLL